MTVVSSSNTITFAGDGVQTLFDFNFKIFKEEDLAAVVRDSFGIERELVVGSDFKLVSETGNDSGGKAMYPVSGSPLQPGDSLTFYREIAYSQELELVDNDPFSAGLLNEAFDRGVMRDQQLQEQVARALKYDISTPAEDQLMPQEFMRNIITARNDSATARAGAESAFSKSEAAQIAAETAKIGAETAQAAAEYAQSEAEAIAWDGIEHLRSRTPVLSGPKSANEGSTVEVSIVDYVEDSLVNYEIDVSEFGSATLVGSAIKWTLGNVDVDTRHSLKVVKRKRGEIYSETANYNLLVKYVPIQDGPTMAFTNDFMGWPGATIDDEVIKSPAFSVGAGNEKQIVSGQMEVEVSSGGFTILDGTTATSLKVIEKLIKGMILETDQGRVLVRDVTLESESGENIIPTMKAETTDGCTITDGGHINSSTEGWITADGVDDASASFHTFESGVSTGTVTVALSEQKTAYKYRLRSYSNAVSMPKNITVSSKIGASAWTVVDTQKNLNWGNSQWQDFIFSNLVTFDQLKFEFSNSSSGTNIQVDALEIIEASTENSCVINLPAAPTKVFQNPLQGDLLTVGAGTTATTLDTSEDIISGEHLFIDGVAGVAGIVTFADGIYTTDITSFGLTAPPQYASRRINNVFALGAGGVGEYIGPKLEIAEKVTPTNPNLDILDLFGDGSCKMYYPFNGDASNYGAKSVVINTDNITFIDRGDRQGANFSATKNVESYFVSNKTCCYGFYFKGLPAQISANVSLGTVGLAANAVYINAANAEFVARDNSEFDDGNWHYLTSNSVNGVTTVEVDGKVIANKAQVAGYTVGIQSFRVDTTLSEVRVFDRGLTSAEVATLGSTSIESTLPAFIDESTTASQIVLASSESIKDKIFVEGGIHNNILCDDTIDAKVSSVSDQVSVSEDVSLIPTMTGETTDGVTITSNRNYAGSWYPWKIGDKLGGVLDAFSAVFVDPTDLIIDFGEAKRVTKYRISAPMLGTWFPQRCPKSWIMYGSMNGTDWTEVDNVTDQSSWTEGEIKEYSLSTAVDYRFFKLSISANNGSSSGEYVAIGELELLEGAFTTTTTVNLETPLVKVPAKVAIPDRYTLFPTGYTSELSDGKIKITSDKIVLPENEDNKQLAMAVRSPEDIRFTDGKIYIQEKL
ncbi:discoidin domain-containing protein [Desulfovibrio sp. UCD-KL4C]|uniref:discoidin domain-containing protein n=1 Tax=Desulfovibrio sp. UCD-KL4C TaxID=2578120 RepID=UPI0025BFEE05|nr:discoidin domain-containing protein [Desulfovibrio sp. UCD-KL4C]